MCTATASLKVAPAVLDDLSWLSMTTNEILPALNFSESEFAQAGLLDCTQISANELDSDATELPSSFKADGTGVLQVTQQKAISEAGAQTTSLSKTGSFDQAARVTDRLDLSALLGLSESPAADPPESSNMETLRHEICKKRQAAQDGRDREAVEKTNKKLDQNREHQRRFKMRQKVCVVIYSAAAVRVCIKCWCQRQNTLILSLLAGKGAGC